MYQLKTECPFKIVIRKVHHSLQTDATSNLTWKRRLYICTYGITYLIYVIYLRCFVDLESNESKKSIYLLKYLLHAIQVRFPKSKREIITQTGRTKDQIPIHLLVLPCLKPTFNLQQTTILYYRCKARIGRMFCHSFSYTAE